MIKINDRGENVKTLQKKLGIKTDGIFGKETEKAVKEYQAAHGLAADGIVGLLTLKSLGIDDPNLRRITEIIVHCEATPEGEEFPRSTLETSHKSRGFSAYTINGKTEHIGYHYVIHLDGSVESCRPEAIVGCHCSGHNSNSIGISYVGGCPARHVSNWVMKAKDTRTEAQKIALIELLKKLKEKYPCAKIYGHNDFANKACPCFNAKEEYQNL